MVFSQMLIVSPHVVPVKFIQPLGVRAQAFLSIAAPADIVDHEDDLVCVWTTLVPYVKLFYLPKERSSLSDVSQDTSAEAKASGCGGNDTGKFLVYKTEKSEESSMETSDIRSLSLEMVLFFLLTKVARDCHCKVLTEEGLVDFITCLPWHVDTAFREKAKEIVLELRGHIKLQPPKLSNLARAVLAKMHFGLEKVIAASPMELAREIYLY